MPFSYQVKKGTSHGGGKYIQYTAAICSPWKKIKQTENERDKK